MNPALSHARPLGATADASGVFFRVWAPNRQSVEVEFDDMNIPSCKLIKEAEGYFAAHSRDARVGHLYRYRLDERESHPDPYSRFQPGGPHGPSMIVDPNGFEWQDDGWRGVDPAHLVIYELHIGTFTKAGTYRAASEQLESLKDLGVTCLELMPLNEFTGRFGWGYDGVNWFAPFHAYGQPDELRRFVDLAHELGLGVIIDVVYNHFGHDGNFLPRFAAEYLTDESKNPWGSTPNYACEAMRRLAIDNAAYWIREFHFDGLRLDAIQNIHDPKSPSLLKSIVVESRAAAIGRRISVTAEDYLQRAQLLGEQQVGIDHIWNDDFHHACRVALTGNHYGFFKTYRGSAQEIVSSLKHGFLYQGQFDSWCQTTRGWPTRGASLFRFVAFLQNHDAVANTLDGQRIQALVAPGKYRALTATFLLGPQTPLIFMGQEFAASTPFCFFADYPNDMQSLWHSRRKEAETFLQFQDPAATGRILNPCSPETVSACVLEFADRVTNEPTLRLFKDLLAIRRRCNVTVAASEVDGALLTSEAFVFRWFSNSGADRMLIVNLGAQIEMQTFAEPLLAPPVQKHWQQLWSSDAVEYGGMGEIRAFLKEGWQFSSNCAYLFQADASDHTALG